MLRTKPEHFYLAQIALRVYALQLSVEKFIGSARCDVEVKDFLFKFRKPGAGPPETPRVLDPEKAEKAALKRVAASTSVWLGYAGVTGDEMKKLSAGPSRL